MSYSVLFIFAMSKDNRRKMAMRRLVAILNPLDRDKNVEDFIFKVGRHWKLTRNMRKVREIFSLRREYLFTFVSEFQI